MSSGRKLEYTAPTATSVQIESSVALRIAKHAAQSVPNTVSGLLLGVDVHENLLKISQSYSFPSYSTDNSSPYKSKNNVKFQDDLIEELKEAGSSVQYLGFYQSAVSGKFINEQILETMATNQLKSTPNAVLLVHDPLKSKYGLLSLKAFRVSEAYLKTFIANDFQIDAITANGLTHANILEEVPVVIHNNHLVSLYLSSFEQDHFNNATVLESSGLKTQSGLTNLENLIESVDELNNYYYQLNKKKQQQQQQGTTSSFSSKEVNFQELLPLFEKIGYNSTDLEQQYVSQFLADTAVRP
jgi:translation initiation factor 3 subunit H